MSQRDVERLLGRLLTDERLRRRFARDAEKVVADLAEAGMELNPCERAALAAVPVQLVDELAERLDPRLWKCDLSGEQPSAVHPPPAAPPEATESR